MWLASIQFCIDNFFVLVLLLNCFIIEFYNFVQFAFVNNFFIDTYNWLIK